MSAAFLSKKYRREREGSRKINLPGGGTVRPPPRMADVDGKRGGCTMVE